MKFACFGGAAAVADEEAVAAARHRSPRRRGKFFFGSNKQPSSSPGTKRILTSPGRHQTDFHIYDLIAAHPSSSALSSTPSLDSAYSSSSSSCSSSRSSSSSSLSSLDVAPTPAKRRPDEKRRSPATGAAAVLVCLLMMMFCGRLGATLLTAAVLCFFPRTWPPSCRAKSAENLLSASSSPDHRAASRRQAETMRTNAVTDGFLVRNRNK